MSFPVSFTLVFLCLSMANALESFAQQEDFDKIDPVARPSNLTLLTGTVSISDQIFDNIIYYIIREVSVSSHKAVSVVPKFVHLSFPVTKLGGSRCAVLQPSSEENQPAEMWGNVIPWIRGYEAE